MQNQETTNTATDGGNGAAEAAGRFAELGARIKTRVAGVKAQLETREKLVQSKLATVQGKVRGALHTAVEKVKSGLDLPSRTEVTSLAQRIEELDKKLADYETRAAGKGKKKGDGEKTDWA